MSVTQGSGYRTGYHNAGIVSDLFSLRVFRHSSRLIASLIGEKVRHQTNSAVQEHPPLALNSPTPNERGNLLSHDYFHAATPFNMPENIGDFSVLSQSHDDHKDSDGLDVQHLLHSEYTGQTQLSQQPSPDWSGLSRPVTMTSQPVAPIRHALNTPFNNKSDSSVTTHASYCSNNLDSDSGNSHSLSTSQYPISGIHHDSIHTEDILHRTTSHPDVNCRPQSRQHESFTPTMMSTSSVADATPLRPASRVNKCFQPPHERPLSPRHPSNRHHSSLQNGCSLAERPMSFRHASLQHSPRDQAQDHSSSHTLSGSSTSISDPPSPRQHTHTQCSHCRCMAIPKSPLAVPNHIPPSTAAPIPTRPCSRVPRSHDLEVLSDCSLVLGHLAHSPDREPNAESCLLSGGDSSRQTEHRGYSEHSAQRDQKSVDGRYGGDRKRRKMVEKVVIVYMKGGDEEDGGPEIYCKEDYHRGR